MTIAAQPSSCSNVVGGWPETGQAPFLRDKLLVREVGA